MSLAEDKLSRLEEENENLKNEKENLENDKKELENKEKEIQENIEKTASEYTKQTMEAYNSAKENYQQEKTSLEKEKQNEIKDIQNNINEIDAKITEAKNSERKEGNYEIKGDDVIALAKQYEGLGNDNMKEIMEEKGARFDDGQWCSDFVTFILGETYGKDSTPDDFINSCELFCNCQAVADWAGENDRLISNSSDLSPGDAIIIKTESGSLHIGFVDSINDDGTINTVEGNTSGDDGIYEDNGEVNKKKRNPEEVYTYVDFNK